MIGPTKTGGIYVEDQHKTLEFYTKQLGFELRRQLPMGPNADWIEVAPTGAETCSVLHPKSMMPDWEQRKPSVVFHCSDVEATYQKLESNGVQIMQPKSMPWGMFAIFADLDGNECGLTSQRLA